MTEPLRAIDTNIVLRYLLRDIPDQWEKATRLIESGEPLGLTAVALAEVAWTLAGPLHRIDRASVARELMLLLARENIIPLGFARAEGLAALLACTLSVGAANFGDALIAATARSAGLQEIYSFDREFARAGLAPIVPP